MNQINIQDKERYRLLLEQYKIIKNQKPDDILYNSQLAGHDADDDNDYSAIVYDAGMLALFMNKKWKYLLDSDFCCAVRQAKLLGLRLPTNTNKAYSRRKRRKRMIYAMSDIHGHYDLFSKRIEHIKPLLQDNENKLILLGDYIDRGNQSFECIRLAFDLEQEFGKEKVIVLKGNHEVWFEEFLFQNEDVWLAEDKDFFTSGTFLSKEQFKKLDVLPDRNTRIEYIKRCIKENHKGLLSWMRKLRLYYETETQIFVHAGVDEDIPEEEVQWCTIGTPDYMMTGKFPPTVGHFYKDIIAGHVATSFLAEDRNYSDIYFDGQSHYYIDGSAAMNRRILCLAYDENTGKYYQLEEDGKLKEIRG